jgi:hypothetical protein
VAQLNFSVLRAPAAVGKPAVAQLSSAQQLHQYMYNVFKHFKVVFTNG